MSNKLGYTDVQKATEMISGGRPPTPEERNRAIRNICGAAQNTAEAKMVLDALGLMPLKGI